MSVSAVSSGSTLSELLRLSRTSSVSSVDSTSTSSVSGTTTGGTQEAKFSKGAEMFSDLSKLAEQDPTKFKELVSDMASKLEEAASSSTDTEEAKRLNDLADKFSKAAESGDVKDLMPERPPQGQGPAEQAYNANGSDSQDQQSGFAGAPPPPPPGGHQSSTLDDLFAQFQSGVSAALGEQ